MDIVKETAHTSGPWKAEVSLLTGGVSVTAHDGRVFVVGVGVLFDDAIDNNTLLSNADLIAAAPELLEALIGLIPICSSFMNDHHCYYAKAKAAVAKALGKI